MSILALLKKSKGHTKSWANAPTDVDDMGKGAHCAASGLNGFICTRPKGHGGEHRARFSSGRLCCPPWI